MRITMDRASRRDGFAKGKTRKEWMALSAQFDGNATRRSVDISGMLYIAPEPYLLMLATPADTCEG